MTPLPPLLLRGDCLVELQRIPDASVDAIVTDPPYGLDFMGKDWDNAVKLANGMLGQISTNGERNPGGGPLRKGGTHSQGYANHDGLAFELWTSKWASECLRILKPGGHMLAFGGSRTWHRLAAGIEDAGFEIRDSIAWLYGSGFPKSLDVSKAIDKAGGNAHLAPQIAAAIKEARIAHGWTKAQADAAFCNGSTLYSWYEGRPRGIQTPTPEVFARMVEAWPELAPWAEAVAEVEREVTGRHRSGLAVGPAGVGASGEGKERRDRPATDAAREWEGWGTALKPAFEPIVVARKPLSVGGRAATVAANVLAHGTGALNIDATRIGHASEADLAASLSKNPGRGGETFSSGVYGAARPQQSVNTSGRHPANVILDESQAAELDRQSGTTRSTKGKPRGSAKPGNGWGMTATGSEYADAGGASRFFYVAKAPKSERPNVDGVAHPTVKPLALMRWLVRLVTPPGGVIVDLFAGSGTTLEAAYLEGFESIGVELTPEYWPLIEARIARAVERGGDR